MARWGTARCVHIDSSGLKASGRISLHQKLLKVLEDVHAFSCISNLAYQTTRKLAPEMYNEAMISIIYRLMHLSFEPNSLEELLRLGLLCYSTTIFLFNRYDSPYQNLLRGFLKALIKLHKAQRSEMLSSIQLWLVMLPNLINSNGGNRDGITSDPDIDLLPEVLERYRVVSWSQAREMLLSVAWVGFVHDQRGETAFHGARARGKG